MSVFKKMLPVIIITAVSIAVLLSLMMNEFYNYGLSYMAVVFGFCAVGVLQISSIYMTEKVKEMPQPLKYW
ncbi:MAG: hypothetical protein WC626_07330 [Methanoregula sp.]